MIIAIILALAAFIAAFSDRYDYLDGFFEWAWAIFVHLFLTGLFWFIGCVIACIIGIYMPKHWEGNTTQLASLKDASGVQGSFVLGTGTINTTQYYMWYEKSGNGYRPNKIEVGTNVLIIEDSTLHGTGTVKVETRKMNNKFLARWIVYDVSLWFNKYTLTIPVGSIKKDFKLE